MKKKKLLSRLLAIKSDKYNSEFHSDYQKQKRNSPLIKNRNEFPKISQTINNNILLPVNLHKSLNLLNSTRNSSRYNNDLNNFQLNSPHLETEQIYYPKIFQNNFYLRDSNSAFKTKIQKKDNKSLSLKYLELFQDPREIDFKYINNLIQYEDNFFENKL